MNKLEGIVEGLELCIDCVLLVANDDTTSLNEEDAEKLRESVSQRWVGFNLVLNCPEDCEGHFSWRSCDGCGSILGGDRHPGVAFPV